MAPAADLDESIKYLLCCLKHTEMSKPDYSAIANEAGISNAHNAKLKALVEHFGFGFFQDNVVSADGTVPNRTLKNPWAKKGTKDTPPAINKKRNIQEATMDDAKDDSSAVKDDAGEDDNALKDEVQVSEGGDDQV